MIPRVNNRKCNTLRGRIKGSHRATNLIMPSHQGNQGIIQIMPGKVAFSIHPMICRLLEWKTSILYIVDLVTFTSGIEYFIFLEHFKVDH